MKEQWAQNVFDVTKNLGVFERIPSHAVENIILNDDLLYGTNDKRLHCFSNPDYLLARAGFFGIGRPETHMSSGNTQIQPGGSNRAFIQLVDPGYIDEHGVVHGVFDVKGTGMTNRNSHHVKSGEPAGLFGERHAIQDMHVSNTIANHGGRVSRGIAVLTLNHDYLKRLKPFPSYDLSKAIETIESNRDQTCLYVRLIPAERGAGFIKSEKSMFNPARTYERALNIVLQEISSVGRRNFLERYKINSYYSQIFSKNVSEDSVLLTNQRVIAMRAYFSGFNQGVFERVSQVHFKNKLGGVFAGGNDDLLGSLLDFENSLDESDQYFPRVSLIDMSGEIQDEIGAGMQAAWEACQKLNCKLPS